jgi:hypothetical protein
MDGTQFCDGAFAVARTSAPSVIISRQHSSAEELVLDNQSVNESDSDFDVTSCNFSRMSPYPADERLLSTVVCTSGHRQAVRDHVHSPQFVDAVQSCTSAAGERSSGAVSAASSHRQATIGARAQLA